MYISMHLIFLSMCMYDVYVNVCMCVYARALVCYSYVCLCRVYIFFHVSVFVCSVCVSPCAVLGALCVIP